MTARRAAVRPKTASGPRPRKRRTEPRLPAAKGDGRARRWLRDPRYAVPAALAPIAVVAGFVVVGGGDFGGEPARTAGVESSDASPREGDESSSEVEGRPSPSDTDEQAVGEPATAGGLDITVTDATIGGDSRGHSQLVVLMTLVNGAAEPLPYAVAAFSLATAAGPVLRPAPSDRPDALGFGTLEPNEQLTASLTFDAPPGTHMLVLDPPTPDGRRLSWTIAV